MAVLGILIVVLALAPVTIGLSRIAEAWCVERRRDVVFAVGGFATLCFALGLSVVLIPPRASPWQMIAIPPLIAAVGGEIALGIITINLAVIDHLTGRREMALRTMFGAEQIQRRIPFYSLRTPIDVLRRDR